MELVVSFVATQIQQWIKTKTAKLFISSSAWDQRPLTGFLMAGRHSVRNLKESGSHMLTIVTVLVKVARDIPPFCGQAVTC